MGNKSVSNSNKLNINGVEKVNRIKKMIASGIYDISSKKIAKSIMEHIKNEQA